MDYDNANKFSIGYARTSKESSNIQNQVQAIAAQGVTPNHIFLDEAVSGTVEPKRRAGMKQLLSFINAHEGQIDKLYVFEITRLGRTFVETLNLIADIETNHGIIIYSLSPMESWFQIEDRSIRNGIILPILSWVAQRELENTRERIKLGLERARKEGKKLGRPFLDIDWKQVEEYRSKDVSVAAISRLLNIPQGTFYRRYAEYQRTKQVKELMNQPADNLSTTCQ